MVMPTTELQEPEIVSEDMVVESFGYKPGRSEIVVIVYDELTSFQSSSAPSPSLVWLALPSAFSQRPLIFISACLCSC